MPGQHPEQIKDPRRENLFDLYKYTFCPNFKLLSATVLICGLQLLVQCMAWVHTMAQFREMNVLFFLGPQFATLQTFGMRIPWRVQQNYELHRLFLPTMLHFGFAQFVIDIALQIALGTIVESVLGPLRLCLFYAVVTVGSNLWGVVVTSNANAVGSEPIIFAYLACLFAVMIVFWGRIDANYCAKVCIVFQLVFVTLICAVLTSQQASSVARFVRAFNLVYPDTLSCIGGFLYGMSAGLFLIPQPVKNSQGQVQMSNLIAILGGACLLVVVSVALVLSLFVSKPYLVTPDYEFVDYVE